MWEDNNIRCTAMNGAKPVFLENTKLTPDYYETPNPYKNAPVCNVNLLELSRYAKRIGKKLTELTKEEVEQFTHRTA